LLGGFFAFSGVMHFKHRHAMAQYAHSKHVPAPEVMVFISGLMLAFGGFAIIANIYPLVGMWLIVFFLVPATFMMHNFWRHKDSATHMAERTNFAKNIALVGALIMIIVLSSVFLMH
jgi:putative oxidoreductase